MGGTSAFGTRAGDVFTKITIGLAIIWTILAAGNVYALRITGNRFKGGSAVVPTAPALESTAGSDVQLGDESKPEGDVEMPAKSEAGGENPATETKPAPSSESAAPADNATPDEKPGAEKPDAAGF
jgi:preprotein translocase subunit SecG